MRPARSASSLRFHPFCPHARTVLQFFSSSLSSPGFGLVGGGLYRLMPPSLILPSTDLRRVPTSDCCSPPVRLQLSLHTCREASIESNPHIDLLLTISRAVHRRGGGGVGDGWRVSNANHAVPSDVILGSQLCRDRPHSATFQLQRRTLNCWQNGSLLFF